jgi:uncharacterized protein YegP (UPF0339 family)
LLYGISLDTISGDFLQELKFELYEDKSRKEWTWELRFRNGKLIANGAESYKDYEVLRALIQLIKENTEAAPIIIN